MTAVEKEQADVPAPQEKRGRGRPKGSTAKKALPPPPPPTPPDAPPTPQEMAAAAMAAAVWKSGLEAAFPGHGARAAGAHEVELVTALIQCGRAFGVTFDPRVAAALMLVSALGAAAYEAAQAEEADRVKAARDVTPPPQTEAADGERAGPA